TPSVSLGSRLVASPRLTGGVLGLSGSFVSSPVPPLPPLPPLLLATGPPVFFFVSPMPKRKMPPTASSTTATRPRPMPRINVMFLPPGFFFFGPSSSSPRRGPGLVLPAGPLPGAPLAGAPLGLGFLAVTLPGEPGLAFLAAGFSSSSPALGSSTTKRYLHF